MLHCCSSANWSENSPLNVQINFGLYFAPGCWAMTLTNRVLPDKYLLEKGKDKIWWRRERQFLCVFIYKLFTKTSNISSMLW